MRILGRLDDALASYHEAIRLDPTLALSYLHISQILDLQGSPDAALKWARLAAESEPDKREPRQDPASLDLARDEPPQAAPSCEKCGQSPATDVSDPTPEAWGSLREYACSGGAPVPIAQDGRPDGNGNPNSSANLFAGAGCGELFAFDQELGIPWASVGPDDHPAVIKAKQGVSLLASGRAAEALIHFREALVQSPDSAILHHKLGNALRTLGLPRESPPRLISRRFSSHSNRGSPTARESPSLSSSRSSLEEALKWQDLAVTIEPRNIDFWAELASLCVMRDETARAVDCRRQILELGPTDPVDARVELGAALQDDGRPDEAMAEYQAALRAYPNSADVHASLGGIHEEFGDLRRAEQEIRTAIQLAPGFAGAYARLATLLRGSLPDDDVGIIEGMLADSALESQPRARLLFGLAHVLDGRGDFHRAADCARKANALTLESKRSEGMGYRPEEFERWVDRLIGSFDPEFFRRTAGLGLDTRRPVFVFGLPRSGTTLVEQILSSHPRIFGAGERTFGRRSFERMPAILGSDGPPVECLASLDECSIKRLAGEHLGKLNALDLGRHDRIVDKLPDNYLYIGLLAAMFPKAVFIHCRRDPRDVAVSCWMSDFRSIRWANDAGQLASRIRQYRRLVEHWGRVFPAPVLTIEYADVVSDLEGVARRLLDACQLEWDPACLEFYRSKRVVRTASVVQVRQPIYTSSLDRWRHYQHDLGDLFAAIAANDTISSRTCTAL